ncbi:MAG: diaminopimelate decarboxylase [Clostridia bacterium]|nr:diaminopimelate decarboxylase [Clostridia bacterium]
MLHDNLSVNESGNLAFCGKDTVELAKKYGTPLMLLDEEGIRFQIRRYLRAMKSSFGEGSFPLYAGKALCIKEIYRIAKEEGIGVDLVSSGEIYTALSVGFPLSKAFFHGNNKTDADIKYAMDNGIGYFVTDNFEELNAVNEYAKEKGVIQKIVLRLTPGIDPHTHAAISTGKVDSKFGVAIETGQADKIVEYAFGLSNVALVGFHCHIGSQIFDIKPFTDAADIMIKYIGKVKETLGRDIEILNLGGGFGVRYVESDPVIDYEDNIFRISEHIKDYCGKHDIKMPIIVMEPGRSIVAANGMTLYTAGSVKEITGYKNYLAIDGGMGDNPRYALYKSSYTVLNAGKMNLPADYKCVIAGRCCESGDLIQEDVVIPKPQRNDTIAVLVTGAYNYSMASNYNRLPRPAIVAIDGQEEKIVVKRETFEDLVRNDV